MRGEIDDVPRLVPERTAVRRALDAGIDAIVAAEAAPDDTPTPCSAWTVHDLARHLEAIAGAYVLWVAAAVGGRVGVARTGSDLDAWNATLLARLPDRSTASHLERFAELADDHRRLVDVSDDHPLLETPHGRLWTVGEHAGIAAVEWHVHAWDLARAHGRDHVPDDEDAGTLHAVWDELLTDVTGTRLAPAADLWTAVLVASGRTP